MIYSSLNAHVDVLSNNFFIQNCLFEHIVYQASGGAISCYSPDSSILIRSCFFIDNHITNQHGEGGSLHVTQCKEISVVCCLFDKNSAYYTCSFFISDRNTPFKTKINQVAAVNEYKSFEYSHLEVFGGNPLLVSNFNNSHNSCPNHGFCIDCLEAETHNILIYIIFSNCQVGNGYFYYDQLKMPKKYFCDRSAFVNNTISTFIANIGFSDISPSFFNCDFNFESVMPVFNCEAHFYDCYVTPAIVNIGQAVIHNTKEEENSVVLQISRFECPLSSVKSCEKHSLKYLGMLYFLLFLSDK